MLTLISFANGVNPMSPKILSNNEVIKIKSPWSFKIYFKFNS